jgi:hypothetical protein
MAVLSDSERAQLATDIMQALSANREGLPVCLKDDIRAAVNAADAWCSSNAASYNSALPLTFRQNANADQKSRLLELVITRRRKVGA